MRIYVASSWRNLIHPGIIHVLRRIGHEVDGGGVGDLLDLEIGPDCMYKPSGFNLPLAQRRVCSH